MNKNNFNDPYQKYCEQLLKSLNPYLQAQKHIQVATSEIAKSLYPVEWICKSDINENALEILTETKGISRDDIKRIFHKHLEKPLNEMMEELTKISSEFFMKMFIEETESSNEWH